MPADVSPSGSRRRHGGTVVAPVDHRGGVKARTPHARGILPLPAEDGRRGTPHRGGGRPGPPVRSRCSPPRSRPRRTSGWGAPGPSESYRRAPRAAPDGGEHHVLHSELDLRVRRIQLPVLLTDRVSRLVSRLPSCFLRSVHRCSQLPASAVARPRRGSVRGSSRRSAIPPQVRKTSAPRSAGR